MLQLNYYALGSALETSVPLDFFAIHESLSNAHMIHHGFLLCSPLGSKRTRYRSAGAAVKGGGEALIAFWNLTWESLRRVEKSNYSVFASSSLLYARVSMSWPKGHCGGFFFSGIKYYVYLLGGCCVDKTLLKGRAASQGTDTQFCVLSYSECVPVRKQ